MFRRLDPFARLPCCHGFVMFLIRGLCSVYLAFTLAMGTPSLASIPFLIFAPFEGSSSSYPCHVEGFFLELPSCVPTLSWGVQWNACLVWPSLHDVGSLAPAPLLHEGLLPGASLHMPTLSWGVQWSTCLSGLHRASSVLQSLPLLHRGLLLGTSCAHAHFILGRPVEYLSVWSSIVRLSSCGSCLLLYRGLF